MNQSNRRTQRSTQSDLERVIEPLAGYICATDQPEAALRSAWGALLSEVGRMNRVANAHIATFSENHWS